MQTCPEVWAAVRFIAGLVERQSSKVVMYADALDVFQLHLCAGLQRRLERSWHPELPEKGNARRAFHWNTKRSSNERDTEVFEALAALHYALFGLSIHLGDAVQLLPHSFTLWIDPGCVSVLTRGEATGDSLLDAYEKCHEELFILWQSPRVSCPRYDCKGRWRDYRMEDHRSLIARRQSPARIRSEKFGSAHAIPVKYTLHDNGNVGVLGSNVKLGLTL
ncbi:hypothetical protein MYAM1_000348 [Malassezia yamatoensis]|uniref:Anti-proliferative protein domain-containing protein n=1 Tax=Malassezia yamatoensis TaxID=253288 RepID=A0AAJ5YWG3_9BASI|nr:hypothetical protein MYAM1_000348 [Malassezia yamatoensis]